MERLIREETGIWKSKISFPDNGPSDLTLEFLKPHFSTGRKKLRKDYLFLFRFDFRYPINNRSVFFFSSTSSEIHLPITWTDTFENFRRGRVQARTTGLAPAQVEVRQVGDTAVYLRVFYLTSQSHKISNERQVEIQKRRSSRWTKNLFYDRLNYSKYVKFKINLNVLINLNEIN